MCQSYSKNSSHLLFFLLCPKSILYVCFLIQSNILGGAVLRWWRNRMGRPISPSQIHQKNISTLSKLHKTTSECWQRTQAPRKADHWLQKQRNWTSEPRKKKKKSVHHHLPCVRTEIRHWRDQTEEVKQREPPWNWSYTAYNTRERREEIQLHPPEPQHKPP